MSIVKDKNKQKIDLVKTVVKRDGRVCKFNIEKVKKVIAWAIDGLNINPLKLEASVDIIFKDKITTSDIQENLIYHCLSLTNVEEPDFRIASGRLFMMNRWKDTQRNRGYKYSEFAKHVEMMVLKKRYDEKILKIYSKD